MDDKQKEAIHAGFAIIVSVSIILFLAYLAYASKTETQENQGINLEIITK